MNPADESELFREAHWQIRVGFDREIERALMGDRAMETRRSQLDREIARHRDKLERAEALREQLAGIPDTDPFPDGMVLVFDAHFAGNGPTYSYAALRAAGKWYRTGQVGAQGHGMLWSELVDWWLEHKVDMVGFYEQTSAHSLGDLPQPPAPPEKVETRGGRVHKDGTPIREFPVVFCGNSGEDHDGHVWHSSDTGTARWCAGQGTLSCEDTGRAAPHGPHVWHQDGRRLHCMGG